MLSKKQRALSGESFCQRSDYQPDRLFREAPFSHGAPFSSSLRRHGEYRVWSAAVSTGEEPGWYRYYAGGCVGMAPSLKVFASDIDTEVLESEKRYLSPSELKRYRRSSC